ncbi:MAG: hypothetical protein IKW49_01655 [Opitutales bacterium]|nr:hypothetical protein [Opitutales bacterium]
MKPLTDKMDATYTKVCSLETKHMASISQLSLLVDAVCCHNRHLAKGALKGRIALAVLSVCVFIQFVLLGAIAIVNGLL